MRLDAIYVLDYATRREVDALTRYADYANRDAWERTRLQMYASVAPHARKDLTPADMMRFSWEVGDDGCRPSDVPKENELKAVAEWAKMFHVEQKVKKDERK